MRGQYLLLLSLFLIPLAWPVAPTKSAPDFRIYGVADDHIRNHRTAEAEKASVRITHTGFNTVRSTVPWVPGQEHLNKRDEAAIRNLVRIAEAQGLRICLTVFPWKDTRTPVISSEQWDFVNFLGYLAETFPEVKCWEIGNEPNLGQFFRPQFGADGKNISAKLYFRLLARSYDRLKGVSPENIVIGGALASEGRDDPWAPTKTTSPTVFIRKLGEAYRESGRKGPVMDWFSLHPYGTNSSEAPDTPHPDSTTIGFADYEKLTELLGEAFDGTAQEGSTIPILYSEYGVDSLVPAEKAHLYQGSELASTKPVPEEVQGAYYRRAFELAACQPTVVGVMLFQVTDETDLARWQSGIHYPDGKGGTGGPKKSQPIVKEAIQETQNGFRC